MLKMYSLFIALSNDDIEILHFPKSSKLNETDGLYDVVMFGNLPKDDIDSPSSVVCVLSIPGTNYTSRAEGTVFCKSRII